jgi:UDP-MurNAc hydroxylase
MTADRIRWINHAGFELQTEGIRLVCDPWLHGLAFNQSWALLSETRYQPADFDGVDFIWLSHEHPDHFSPASLRAIPSDIRAKITVLFQKAKDGRVAKFCRDLGFKEVRELQNWQPVALAPGVSFSLRRLDDDLDSLCFIKTPQQTYLNINDCVVRDLNAFHRDILSITGRPDVLLTQFSYANWTGNPGDVAAMKTVAEAKLKEIELQLAIYHPKILIPFASFVWFCRSDNFHLNAGANAIADVFERFHNGVACVALYPDDLYTVGEPWDSPSAIRRYQADAAAHAVPLDVVDEIFSIEQLQTLADRLQEKVRSKNSVWMLRPLQLLGYVKPIAIYLTDLKRSLTYSMFDGIDWKNDDSDAADIEFASGAFAQMLRYGTGFDTLYISGRFAERRPGARVQLGRNFVLPRRNEAGQFFPATFFDVAFLRKHLGFD